MPEVLIVIAIMGLLFAIATSTWTGVTESRKVDFATNQLAAELRLAHTSATNQLTEWRVVFGPDGDPVDGCSDADYCLVRVTASGTENSPRSFPDGTGISGTNLAPDSSGDDGVLEGVVASLTGPSEEDATTTVRFPAEGSAKAEVSGGGEPRITVGSDSGAQSHDVELNPSTSRVQVDP